ncbi:speckle-type POZ protein [Nephila pilipes]|uniref:Speckle-type POZ protein n=1 Tax=Nephila pilipes TaxID=299642 RepID=A0A8X6NLT1_NEPPI|nr:speckle-type POZ protein [Nephila pilipes]
MASRNGGRVEYTLVWTIENFSYAWHKIGEKLISPVFVTHKMDSTSWVMELFPRGTITGDYISIFLRRLEDRSFKNCKVVYEFVATSSGGSIPCFRENCSDYQSGQRFGCHLFMRRDEIESENQRLNGDILTMNCRMRLCEEVYHDFVAESFAKTRILVERIDLSRHFLKNIKYESIFVQRMSDSLILMIIRLRLDKKRNLVIEFIPYDCCQHLKYSSLRLTLDDMRTSKRLYEYSKDICDVFMPLSLDVPEYALYLSQRLAESSNYPSIRLDFELIFCTGMEHRRSEKIESQDSGENRNYGLREYRNVLNFRL